MRTAEVCENLVVIEVKESQAQWGGLLCTKHIMKEKACSVCMANCVRLHGDAGEDPEEKLSPTDSSGPVLQENGASGSHQKKDLPTEIFPSFLKRMTELTLSSSLQMPASFVKNSIANIGSAVTLEGPGKGKWRVEIGQDKENHSLEFREGWQKFVADHILQIGDQLSFTLIAGSFFQVVVYDGSGSQKVSASDATNSPLTHQLIANGVQVGDVVQARPKPVSRPKQKVRRKLRTEGATQSEVKVVPPVVHSSESELRNCITPETKSKETASVEKSEDEPDTDENHLLLLPPHVILDGHVISERRAVTAEEKERALNAAKSYPISNPKLVVVMSKGFVYRGFWMALSRPFAKAYMPQETRDVTLLNMAGNQWTVKWLFKESGSGFSGGWRGFSLDHRLEESDVCVLELVDAKNFVILVHIFRVIGAPKEDLGDYRPAPGRARNAGQPKRKMVPDSSYPGPSSSNKCSNLSAKYSKVEDLDPSQWQTPAKVEQLSCSKRAPKNSAKVVSDETLAHKGKKVKASPTTSCEVYAEYVSFVTPPPGGVENAALEVRPLNSKQAATTDKVEATRENLLKLGKELAGQQTAKSASPSLPSHSDGNEKMQNGPPILDKEILSLREACECTH